MKSTSVLILAILIQLSLLGLITNFSPTVEAQPNPVSTKYEFWSFPVDNIENFTIIVLPDTQYYSKDYPWVFDNQTQWITENIENLNIIFVTHLGDIVDGWNVIEQWENANNSMSKLDAKVAWGVSPGNHDGLDSDPNNFENYFGCERFENESWYGGAYNDNNKNSYQLFSAGEEDYLFLHLHYNPNDDILAWASNVIDNYPSRQVIVSTHDYIDWSWTGWRSSIGERVYQKLVKPHADQILLVLCGHVDMVDTRTEVIDGQVVHEMVSDYQEQPKGGNGWLKILEFSPVQDKIFVKTYSPYLDRFNHSTNSEFTLDYNMTSTTENINVKMINSTLLDFSADIPNKQINVKVSGEMNEIGFCNVTIPKELHLGNSWAINIDGVWTYEYINPEKGIPWNYYLYENTTHTSLFFKYIHTATPHQILFIVNETIPEFPSQTIIILLAITTVVAVIYRKRITKKC